MNEGTEVDDSAEMCAVVPVESCDVSHKLASAKFRNGPHWHTVWPDGGHWCYETEAAAAERADELNGAMASEFERYLAEQLEDPEVRAGYEAEMRGDS